MKRMMKLKLKIAKFQELLNLTVNQRSALLEDRVDRFTRILEGKERIIKELDSIDNLPEEKSLQMEQDPVGLSEELHKIMIELSKIEEESISLLASNLQKVGKELKEIQQMRKLRKTYGYALF